MNVSAAIVKRLAVALGAAAVLSVPSVHAQDVVKIGFASPLTGGQANYGKDNQNGAQMAIDELNAQGVKIGGKAVKFELMSEDDQADPKMGPVVAQKYAPYFYDGVMTIAAAMKAANSTDPARYLPALANINYKGITADISSMRMAT